MPRLTEVEPSLAKANLKQKQTVLAAVFRFESLPYWYLLNILLMQVLCSMTAYISCAGQFVVTAVTTSPVVLRSFHEANSVQIIASSLARIIYQYPPLLTGLENLQLVQ